MYCYFKLDVTTVYYANNDGLTINADKNYLNKVCLHCNSRVWKMESPSLFVHVHQL